MAKATKPKACLECGELNYGCICKQVAAAIDIKIEPTPPSFPEDPVVEAVLRRMFDRAKKGMVDYGISMEDEKRPVRVWLDDAIEELLDAALYLEKLKRLL